MHKAFPVTLSLSHAAPKSDPNRIVWAEQWEADSIWCCKTKHKRKEEEEKSHSKCLSNCLLPPFNFVYFFGNLMEIQISKQTLREESQGRRGGRR